MKIRIALPVLLCLLLAACAPPTNPQFSSAEPASKSVSSVVQSAEPSVSSVTPDSKFRTLEEASKVYKLMYATRNIIAVDEQSVYMCGVRTIGRRDQDGTTTVLHKNEKAIPIQGLDLHGEYVYYISGRRLYRIPKCGGESHPLSPILPIYMQSMLIEDDVLYMSGSGLNGKNIYYFHADISGDPDELTICNGLNTLNGNGCIGQMEEAMKKWSAVRVPNGSGFAGQEFQGWEKPCPTDRYVYFRKSIGIKEGESPNKRMDCVTGKIEDLPIESTRTEEMTALDGWIYYFAFIDAHTIGLWRISEDLTRNECLMKETLMTIEETKAAISELEAQEGAPSYPAP